MDNEKIDDLSSNEALPEERYDSRPSLGYTLIAVIITAVLGAVFSAILMSLLGR